MILLTWKYTYASTLFEIDLDRTNKYNSIIEGWQSNLDNGDTFSVTKLKFGSLSVQEGQITATAKADYSEIMRVDLEGFAPGLRQVTCYLDEKRVHHYTSFSTIYIQEKKSHQKLRKDLLPSVKWQGLK